MLRILRKSRRRRRRRLRRRDQRLCGLSLLPRHRSDRVGATRLSTLSTTPCENSQFLLLYARASECVYFPCESFSRLFILSVLCRIVLRIGSRPLFVPGAAQVEAEEDTRALACGKARKSAVALAYKQAFSSIAVLVAASGARTAVMFCREEDLAAQRQWMLPPDHALTTATNGLFEPLVFGGFPAAASAAGGSSSLA